MKVRKLDPWEYRHVIEEDIYRDAYELHHEQGNWFVVAVGPTYSFTYNDLSVMTTNLWRVNELVKLGKIEALQGVPNMARMTAGELTSWAAMARHKPNFIARKMFDPTKVTPRGRRQAVAMLDTLAYHLAKEKTLREQGHITDANEELDLCHGLVDALPEFARWR